MGRGIVQIAFGKEYEKAALASAASIRANCGFHISILTDIPAADRSLAWGDILDCTLILVGGLHNRDVKTSLDLYSPYDHTLYIDCDTITHTPEIATAFDMLKYCDIAFPMHTADESAERIKTPIYQEALADFKVTDVNTLVCQGGIFVFNRTESVRQFFSLWNTYWNHRKFRDMPPLLAAVCNSGLAVGMLSREFGFTDSKIIQHFYGWKPPRSKMMPQFIKDAPNEKTRRWEPRKTFR